METIILAIDHKGNRKLLNEWLSVRYNVIEKKVCDEIKENIDLCIVDGVALSHNEEQLKNLRESNAPVFVPVIFITRKQDIGLATKSLWKTVDELIVTPIEKIELDARVHNMLMIRKLSLQLKERDEALLRSSEERYYQLFNLSPDALFIIDTDGSFVECSNVAIERYGYSREEFRKMKVPELSADDLREKEPDQVRKALESSRNVDSRHRKKDGTEIPVDIKTIPIELDGKKMILASVRDITERKKAEEKIQTQLKELQNWQSVTLGRELRTIELKKEVNELLEDLGKPKRYDV